LKIENSKLTKLLAFKMTANVMIASLGESLQGFFEYCEENKQSSAKDLSSLFAKYFSLPECSPAKKKVAVIKKVAAHKASKSGPLPREQQTLVVRSYIESKDAKLPELKKLAGERGLSKTGKKALIIENILKYEESFKKIETEDEDSQEDSQDEDSQDEDFQDDTENETENETDDEDSKIVIPKRKMEKVRMETTQKMKVVYSSRLLCYFVLDEDSVAVGWFDEKDSHAIDKNDDKVNPQAIDIYKLEDKHYNAAKKLGYKCLKYLYNK
jgi:hypothetical protein